MELREWNVTANRIDSRISNEVGRVEDLKGMNGMKEYKI